MRKLACDPTTHTSRPTGDDGDSAFKSSHLSEDYDAFCNRREPAFSAASSDLGHDLKNRGGNRVRLVGGKQPQSCPLVSASWIEARRSALYR